VWWINKHFLGLPHTDVPAGQAASDSSGESAMAVATTFGCDVELLHWACRQPQAGQLEKLASEASFLDAHAQVVLDPDLSTRGQYKCELAEVKHTLERLATPDVRPAAGCTSCWGPCAQGQLPQAGPVGHLVSRCR
jgi:hypothetical protein